MKSLRPFVSRSLRHSVTRSLGPFVSPSLGHFVTLSLGLLVISCSTDFEVEADWKDIPVVYGLLSVQDTAHYIRVEKAFLQPGGDATKIAQIADSLYYDSKVQVQLRRVSNGQTFTLQRVDGAQEGYPRKEGSFATVPNILYKIKDSDIDLKADEMIQLIINRGETLEPVTAQTTVLGNIVPVETAPPSVVNMGYDRSIPFGWNAPTAAKIFDLRLILHYRESLPGNPTQFENKSLTWILAEHLERSSDNTNRLSYSIEGVEFYKFLQANLQPVSDRIRQFDSFDIQIIGAGQEILEQLRLSEANTGVTSSQTIPIYTNLSEGRGIFSSISTAFRAGITINGVSQDSLRDGIYTRNLNFK